MVAPALLPALWAASPALPTLPPNSAEALGFLPVRALVLNPGCGKGLVPCAAPADLPSPGGAGLCPSPLSMARTLLRRGQPQQEMAADGTCQIMDTSLHLVAENSCYKKKRFSGAMEVVEAAARPSAGLTPPG